MNEQLTKLIEHLADKLGTTTEHMWGVLLRQAPISASIGILLDALCIALVCFGWKKLCAKKFDGYDADMIRSMSFLVMWLITILCLAVVGLSLSTDIAGFLNPEYWALKQLLPDR
jgi:hypothetical protein